MIGKRLLRSKTRQTQVSFCIVDHDLLHVIPILYLFISLSMSGCCCIVDKGCYGFNQGIEQFWGIYSDRGERVKKEWYISHKMVDLFGFYFSVFLTVSRDMICWRHSLLDGKVPTCILWSLKNHGWVFSPHSHSAMFIPSRHFSCRVLMFTTQMVNSIWMLLLVFGARL